MNLDELSRKESLECEGKIKGLITNPRMTINEKGVKQYPIISYHRFFGTTNHQDPFKTEKDSLIKRQLIIKNLIHQGFYDTTSTQNDSIKLAKALNKFQKKWFIQPDGKLGKYTTQAFSYNREKISKFEFTKNS